MTTPLDELVREKRELVRSAMQKKEDKIVLVQLESKIKSYIIHRLKTPLEITDRDFDSIENCVITEDRSPLAEVVISRLNKYILFVEEQIIRDYLGRIVNPDEFYSQESVQSAQEMVNGFVIKARECVATAKYNLASVNYLAGRCDVAIQKIAELNTYLDQNNLRAEPSQFLLTLLGLLEHLYGDCNSRQAQPPN